MVAFGSDRVEPAQIYYDFTTGILPTGVSVLRASEASYMTSEGTLVSATADVARFDHNVSTGIPLGLVLEGEQTNILSNSAVSVADWGKRNLVANDLALNGLGRFNGVDIISTGRSWGRLQTVCTLQADTKYAITAYLRAGATETCRLIVTSGSGMVIATGTLNDMSVIRNDAGLDLAVIENVLMADGITQRLTMSLLVDTTQTYTLGIGPNSQTAGDSIVLLAVQAETGATTSSYIDTGSVPVTRAADQLQLNGLSGQYDITLTYADGSEDIQFGITINPATIIAAPHGYLQSMLMVPV